MSLNRKIHKPAGFFAAFKQAILISISPLQVFNWSEVSTEAELVVFSTLLAIQHFNRRIDGEHTPPNASLTPT